MINQMAVRMWDGFSLMLSPGFLIDRLLDWVESLGGAIELAQAARLPREETSFERLLD